MGWTSIVEHRPRPVADDFAGYALRELRGDDMAAVRLKVAKQLV